MTARERFETGTLWTDSQSRMAFPLLLSLAKSGRKLTYGALDREVAQKYNKPTIPIVVPYRTVLEKIGQLLNQLSEEWGEEIPPLTILIVNAERGEPSIGVDGFLSRYLTKNTQEQLTLLNRSAMIERATNAVFNYPRWNDVAAYFAINLFDKVAESDPIPLATPPIVLGGESEAHRALKEYIANHPELFVHLGKFEKGQTEYRLHSGDEVDILFQNAEQSLTVEVKTADASDGELTRGIFQCVKYRAVLRAMHDIAGELVSGGRGSGNTSAVATTALSGGKTLRCSLAKSERVLMNGFQRLESGWMQIKFGVGHD